MAKPIPESEARKLMITSGLEPLVPFVNTSTKWLCRCRTCAREVSPTYSKVKKGYKGCLYCAGKKVDLEELTVLLQNLNLIPLHDYPGASTKWRMKCSVCNEEFNSSFSY